MRKRSVSQGVWLLAVLTLGRADAARLSPARVGAQDVSAPDCGELSRLRALSEVETKIAALDAQIVDLETKRDAIGTRGPVAMLVGGFVSFGVLGMVLLPLAGVSKGSARGVGGALLLTLTLGFGGIAWLRVRKHERAPYSRQIRDLRTRRKVLIVGPQLAPRRSPCTSAPPSEGALEDEDRCTRRKTALHALCPSGARRAAAVIRH